MKSDGKLRIEGDKDSIRRRLLWCDRRGWGQGVEFSGVYTLRDGTCLLAREGALELMNNLSRTCQKR